MTRALPSCEAYGGEEEEESETEEVLPVASAPYRAMTKMSMRATGQPRRLLRLHAQHQAPDFGLLIGTQVYAYGYKSMNQTSTILYKFIIILPNQCAILTIVHIFNEILTIITHTLWLFVRGKQALSM